MWASYLLENYYISHLRMYVSNDERWSLSDDVTYTRWSVTSTVVCGHERRVLARLMDTLNR